MLDIKYIKDNKEAVIKNLNSRGGDYQPIIEEVIQLYNKINNLKLTNEQAQQEINAKSKLIGQYKKEQKDISQLLEEINAAKAKLNNEEQKELQNKFDALILTIPNLVREDTPIGADENENVEVMKVGEIPSFDFAVKPHEEVGVAQADLLLEKAVKIAKSRFVVSKDFVARLERAISNFMLDTHTSRGYTEYSLPVIVSEDSLYASGQLPKFSDDLFKISATNNEEDEFSSISRDFYLIPTAEVGLANLYRNEIIDEDMLTQSICAYTQCFRKEAGSAGRDTRGIIRVHQFGKVELFKYTTPESSAKELEKMVDDARFILDQLQLPYRVVRLCSGDMGFSAQVTFDIEVYFPSQERYRECSSCSCVGDFQARRGKIRYRDKAGNICYPHMLNGSGMATGRILAAILENYQNADGTVTIPKVLEKYFNN